MADTEPQALPAATPTTDPVSDYFAQVQQALAAPREGYVDPHFTDNPSDPDAEDFGTARDQLGEPVETTTPTEQATAAPQEPAQQQEEEVVEQVEPTDDPDAPLPPAQDEPQQQPQEGDKPPQFRLRPAKGDKLGEQALWFMRRNPDMPLETAMQKARAQLGIQEPAVSTTTPTQEDQNPQAATPQVESLEALESKRVELRNQLKEARESLDYDEQARIQSELDDLVYDAIPKAREATARQAQEQHTQTFTAIQLSAQKAAELYPDAAQEGSEFFNRMIEIEQALTHTGDPLINDPNKPLVIAQMAARELNIAPQRKGTAQPPTAAPSQQPRPAARVQMTAPLASPGARVTTAPVPAIEQAIEKVSSPEEYEALMNQIVGKRR